MTDHVRKVTLRNDGMVIIVGCDDMSVIHFIALCFCTCV